jgi:hypothetical protein
MKLKAFYSPARLTFTETADDIPRVPVGQLERGVIFLREGQLCMRLEYADYHGVVAEKVLKGIDAKTYCFIANLRTGRSWPVSTDEEVILCRATVTLEVE